MQCPTSHTSLVTGVGEGISTVVLAEVISIMAFRWWLFAYLLIVVAASSEDLGSPCRVLIVCSTSLFRAVQEARSMDDDQPDFVKYLKTPSPGPVVNEKYRPYIPESYRDYIPRMDESGVQYQKYMQGEPDAKKFQDKVLPQGAYQQEIPLSQGAASTKSDAPQVLAAAEAKAKEDSKDAHANKANTDTDPGFMKYLHAPSPGPVVNKKYRPYIPESYRDYIPRMDESGVQYQKYMQGEPDAKKFQDKVLPQGAYQKEIPLSQGAASTKSDAPQVLAAAEAKAKEDSKDAHANKANTDTDPGFMKYLHAPSPGPVVNKKYRPYIPESYRDYIPRMDESGVQYQKYMQGEPDAKKFQDKVLPQGAYQQEIPLSQGAASTKSDAPQVLAAAEAKAKEDSKDAHANKANTDTDPGFMKYLHAPSPGPVVNKKYRPYIPESYRDYIPRMDESGVQYQKYIQGEPDAKKFQDKVLPQGAYQQEIPLSQGAASAANAEPAVVLSSEQQATEEALLA